MGITSASLTSKIQGALFQVEKRGNLQGNGNPVFRAPFRMVKP